MAFDYPVNLDLAGRSAVVFGGGPLACERVTGLLESGAKVTIVTPEATAECRRRACNGDLVLVERRGRASDLKGAFIAICTREDDSPVEKLYAAAQKHGVLFAALDDIPHCMFGAMSQIRRGDLRITVSTGGKAPALAKRIRKDLEETYDERYGELVEVLNDARAQALPRDVPFDEWAARWEAALDDLAALVEAVGEDRRDEVIRHVVERIKPGAVPSER